jgi:hypothetical protein
MKPRCDVCGKTAKQAGGKIEPVQIGSRRVDMCPACRPPEPKPDTSLPDWERVREMDLGVAQREEEY